jgi:hypothetical protein
MLINEPTITTTLLSGLPQHTCYAFRGTLPKLDIAVRNAERNLSRACSYQHQLRLTNGAYAKLNTHAPWFPSAVHAQSPPVLRFEKPHYGQACSAPTNTCFTQPAVVTTESAAASTPASLLFL